MIECLQDSKFIPWELGLDREQLISTQKTNWILFCFILSHESSSHMPGIFKMRVTMALIEDLHYFARYTVKDMGLEQKLSINQ